MATRRILRPWTTQPPLQYGLREQYLNGLLWSYSTTRERSDADGAFPAWGAARGGLYYRTEYGAAGARLTGDNVTVYTRLGAVLRTVSVPVSFALLCDLRQVNGTKKRLFYNAAIALYAGNGSAAKLNVLTRMTDEPIQYQRIEDSATYTSGPTAIAVTAVPKSHITLWRDGVEVGSAQLVDNWISEGGPFDALYSWCGIYGSAIWSRALSPAEMREITSNYWAMYEPQQIYVPRSSGAPAYTHPTLSNARMIWTGPGAGKPAIDYTW